MGSKSIQDNSTRKAINSTQLCLILFQLCYSCY